MRSRTRRFVISRVASATVRRVRGRGSDRAQAGARGARDSPRLLSTWSNVCSAAYMSVRTTYSNRLVF